MTEDSPLEVSRLVFHRGGMRIVDDVSFTLRWNEIFAVVGSNGSGKTALLRLLVGLDVPSAGTVRLFGLDLARASRRELEDVRRQLGVVFQEGGLIDSLTVDENVRLPLDRGARRDRDDVDVKVRVRLIELKIEGYQDFYPAQLSAGVAQRVQLARALVPGPRLLVCDDPGSRLDRPAAAELEELLSTLARRARLTAIVATPDWAMARRLAGRVAVLDRGRLVAVGTPVEIEAMGPEDSRLRRLIDGGSIGPELRADGRSRVDA